MATDAIAVVEASALKRDRGAFDPGDSVRVHVKVIEGEKERVQIFEGTIIRKRGEGARATFTVRRVSLRGRRRADLPAPLPAGRAGPGREVRARPALQALLPPGAHGEGRAPPGEAAGAAGRGRCGARRERRVAGRRAPRPAGRAPAGRVGDPPRAPAPLRSPRRQGCSSSRRISTPRSAAPGRGGSGWRGWTRWAAGPLAGPVVAAAVILDPTAPVDGLRDSKLLTARQRRRLAREIRARALAFAVGRVGPRRIDTGQRAAGHLVCHARGARRGSTSPPGSSWSTATSGSPA